MDSVHRPAARVICFDADGRVLLMHWRDPHDGTEIWEPPGGGLDEGETPLQAARRELVEETGLDPGRVGDHFVDVKRHSRWKGRLYTGTEQFFAARYATPSPPLSRDGLLPYEVAELIGHAWVTPAEFASLPGRLEPPELEAIIPLLIS
ncbi:DNA mismatch repair protein MutT [Paractinoplanes abujensis]|uniref:8-oxo-dGTP pyrophosphatase MutT (NUDIX family) n=1 Tax=Paractinoplanes abujensis TaxID=882441 RepID=A0A7W7CVV0_9ACTN|nr:NUDIX domain-containing protein [Actinoplanes abujensis]MBB4695655.1 8-oxo-dGTP pyrophosphatase MutT (NUDIX family) [Actinoplanes abujensis]GID23240.1 DNA mismatch repair protein MutT [Actinoplanes abujensis]